jgi:glycosyltransferase involved in cell wall biosynthesis
VKIAVMIAAYNAAPFIGSALGSLLRQRDAAQLDIIVVDDGSTDGTGEIARKIAAEAPEVRVITTTNGGVAAARNRALDAVAPDTDLLNWLDADDLSPAGRFARDIRHFTDDPELDFHYGRMRMFRDAAPDGLSPDLNGRYADLRGIQFGAALMRPRLAAAIGRYDDRLVQAEDTDFLFRMFQLRPKMLISDDICVYYRRHGGNITNRTTESSSYYRRVILAHARRLAAGGVAVPRGFFDARRVIEEIDWW